MSAMCKVTRNCLSNQVSARGWHQIFLGHFLTGDYGTGGMRHLCGKSATQMTHMPSLKTTLFVASNQSSSRHRHVICHREKRTPNLGPPHLKVSEFQGGGISDMLCHLAAQKITQELKMPSFAAGWYAGSRNSPERHIRPSSGFS